MENNKFDSDQKETHLINLFKRRSLGEEQAVGSNQEETPFINYSKIKLEHRSRVNGCHPEKS